MTWQFQPGPSFGGTDRTPLPGCPYAASYPTMNGGARDDRKGRPYAKKSKVAPREGCPYAASYPTMNGGARDDRKGRPYAKKSKGAPREGVPMVKAAEETSHKNFICYFRESGLHFLY